MVRNALFHLKSLIGWIRRGFCDPLPQMLKESLLLRHGVKGAVWIETGTYLGQTAKFLAQHAPTVYTVEPSTNLFHRAKNLFDGSNVIVVHGISENVLPGILLNLRGACNFWLDGHFSEGVTFQGPTDCPVVEELNAISQCQKNLGSISILIDDVRCFQGGRSPVKDYPSLDYLVDWARSNNFSWVIESDIFIMKRVV